MGVRWGPGYLPKEITYTRRADPYKHLYELGACHMGKVGSHGGSGGGKRGGNVGRRRRPTAALSPDTEKHEPASTWKLSARSRSARVGGNSAPGGLLGGGFGAAASNGPPQSASQSSPAEQIPSPHTGGQSAGQVSTLSVPVQVPSPQSAGQSPGQLCAVSLPVQAPSPQTG